MHVLCVRHSETISGGTLHGQPLRISVVVIIVVVIVIIVIVINNSNSNNSMVIVIVIAVAIIVIVMIVVGFPPEGGAPPSAHCTQCMISWKVVCWSFACVCSVVVHDILESQQPLHPCFICRDISLHAPTRPCMSDMSRHVSTWHDMTWHDITWYDMTWNDMTLHDMSRHDMTWHDITWHVSTWHDMTWHDMTWHDMTWHVSIIMTWHVSICPLNTPCTPYHVRRGPAGRQPASWLGQELRRERWRRMGQRP